MAVTERERQIKAMKKLYREYKASEDPNHAMFRNSVYYFSILLNYLKHDAEMEIEERVKDLEDKILGHDPDQNSSYMELKKAYGN